CKKVVGGRQDGTIDVWDGSMGTKLYSFPGHKAPITSLAFSPDGKWLASGSADKTVKLWESRQEKATCEVPTGASLAFSPDSKRLAIAGWDLESVLVWEVPDGKKRLLTGPRYPRFLAFSPDGQILGAAGDDGAKFWKLLPSEKDLRITGLPKATGLAFKPDG